MTRSGDSNRAATRWSVRTVPLFIAAAFVIGTYAVVYRLCIHYLYRTRADSSLTATFLALYLIFLVLAIGTYLRTLTTIWTDPGLVPLIRGGDAANVNGKGHGPRRAGRREVEASPWVPPDQSPDSPGLEAFYSKDVFVCEADGRPKWCSECRQWKPDRAHHSSELERCVRKMDHLCPWVGGMVSETSFKFFCQFTFYTTCLCTVAIAAGAYCIQQQKTRGPSLDGWAIAAVALASAFGFFTFAMTLTAARFVFTNTTNIDMLRKRQVFFIAVRIPRNSAPSDAFPTIVYPLPQPQSCEMADAAGLRGNAPLAQGMGRDVRASRKFAILRTEPGDNPWDLGLWGNWKSVMGNHVLDWLLPIRRSPCCDHESMESDYQLGSRLARIKRRYGVPELNSDEGELTEMRNTQEHVA